MGDANRELQEAIKWARHTASARGIRDMLDLAKPDLAVTPDMFERDPWLLNCANGTLELKTGTLREHRREDYLTKLCPTPYDPAATCPTWLAFLEVILPQPGYITYLQRLMGYWLTGDVREQILPIAWGVGANGKTTAVNAFAGVVGSDYCITADKSIVIARKHEGHSTERMDLAGKRLALVMETDEGQAFAESFVKQLTGGDTIRGRRMKENTWEYSPTHKVLLVTNHKPRVKATDHAFWRRVKLIEFSVVIPDHQQDKLLPAKLKSEHPGILAWVVRGCLDWQCDGLAEPDGVRQSTNTYRDSEDVIGQFIAERCTTGAVRSKKTDLLKDYHDWCNANGFRPATSTKLTQALAERGHQLDTGRRWYEGIGLCSDTAGF